MCGRFTMKCERERIKEMFRLQRLGQFDPRYNIAPVTAGADSTDRSGQR